MIYWFIFGLLSLFVLTKISLNQKFDEGFSYKVSTNSLKKNVIMPFIYIEYNIILRIKGTVYKSLVKKIFI